MLQYATQPVPIPPEYHANGSISIDRIRKLLTSDLKAATELGYRDQLLELFRTKSKVEFLKETHAMLHHNMCFIYRGSFDLPRPDSAFFLSDRVDCLSAFSNLEIGIKHKFEWLQCKLKADIAKRLTFHDDALTGTQAIYLDGELQISQTLTEQLFAARIENKDLFFHIVTLSALHAKQNLHEFNLLLQSMKMAPLSEEAFSDPNQVDGNLLPALCQFYFQTSGQIAPIKTLLLRLNITRDNWQPISEEFDKNMELLKVQCDEFETMTPREKSERKDFLNRRNMAFTTFLMVYISYQEEIRQPPSLMPEVDTHAEQTHQVKPTSHQQEQRSLTHIALRSLQSCTSRLYQSIELSCIADPAGLDSEPLTAKGLTSLGLRDRYQAIEQSHNKKTVTEKPTVYP
ncbi:hypothetical protein JQC92_11035 [Shewanella sp. 202IG2-18]|uniref:hypothetical protein n=1 Tax=Parashewanella hymeniacidonis TaxID=2807618 RepID=UPI00195F90A8|nr:hypothetical protein [Parashewanella hymeniacidonis]MBM7072558.1 hypothetical protein [Parashewanella hymeniacidonis]